MTEESQKQDHKRLKSEPRSANQRERDRRNIAKYYLRGKTQIEIADKLKLSQSTISRDLLAIQLQWKHEAARDIGERKAHELAKIDTLELEYWNAWNRSRHNAETIKQKSKVSLKETDITEQERTITGQVGDPRFLAGVQWCIERRCKILGVDSPEKFEHSGPGGKSIPIEIIDKLSDEQLEEIKAGKALENIIPNTGRS